MPSINRYLEIPLQTRKQVQPIRELAKLLGYRPYTVVATVDTRTSVLQVLVLDHDSGLRVANLVETIRLETQKEHNDDPNQD